MSEFGPSLQKLLEVYDDQMVSNAGLLSNIELNSNIRLRNIYLSCVKGNVIDMSEPFRAYRSNLAAQFNREAFSSDIDLFYPHYDPDEFSFTRLGDVDAIKELRGLLSDDPMIGYEAWDPKP